MPLIDRSILAVRFGRARLFPVINVDIYFYLFLKKKNQIVQDYSCRLEAISACFDSGSEVGVELASPVFELHVALQDLQK